MVDPCPPPPRSDVPPCPSRGELLVLAADTEVRRVGGARLATRLGWGAERDPDADLAELAPQDVGLVAGGAHPRTVDRRRRRERPAAPGDVLAERPAPAVRVAGAEDPVDHVGAVR